MVIRRTHNQQDYGEERSFGKLKAQARPHPDLYEKWSVYYLNANGRQRIKGPFSSKISADKWAKGYVNNPANH